MAIIGFTTGGVLVSEASVPVELHIVEGVTHIFDAHPEFAEESARWIDLFLDRHVVNPRTYQGSVILPVWRGVSLGDGHTHECTVTLELEQIPHA